MTVRDTSISARIEITKSGQLGKQAKLIFDMLNGYPLGLTAREVQKKLRNKGHNLGINAVTGRLNDLRKTYRKNSNTSIVIISGQRKCTVTGRSVDINKLPYTVQYGEQIEITELLPYVSKKEY